MTTSSFWVKSFANVTLLVLSVSVRLSVRSQAQDGLIILLTDSKQMDFIVIKLMGGRLMLSADLGKGPSTITSSVTVNDGEWHTVSGNTCCTVTSLHSDNIVQRCDITVLHSDIITLHSNKTIQHYDIIILHCDLHGATL